MLPRTLCITWASACYLSFLLTLSRSSVPCGWEGPTGQHLPSGAGRVLLNPGGNPARAPPVCPSSRMYRRMYVCTLLSACGVRVCPEAGSSGDLLLPGQGLSWLPELRAGAGTGRGAFLLGRPRGGPSRACGFGYSTWRPFPGSPSFCGWLGEQGVLGRVETLSFFVVRSHLWDGCRRRSQWG